MSKTTGLPEAYPEMFQLIAGFFNEDFFDDYEGEAAALDDYISQTSTSTRTQVLVEMQDLRATSATDDDLGSSLRALSNAYRPPGDMTRYDDFVSRLSSRVRASLRPEPPADTRT